MGFLVRLGITAVALLVAAWVVPGIHLATGDRLTSAHDWLTLGGVALIFGVVNAVVRPVLFWLTLPLTIVTLGLFVLILNALMLLLTSGIARLLGLGFRVDGFFAGLVGALVVSIVSFAANRLVAAEVSCRSPRRQ